VTLDFRIAGLGPDAVDYLAAWELQRQVHAGVVAGDQPPTVLLLEHPPVFTAGKRTTADERPADPGGAPVIDVDRGGKITFHGPGQLVGYPIFDLQEHRPDLHWFLRRLEDALIASLADLGIGGERRDQYTGVWTGGRKIASIGIHVKQWVTLHGFALNVTTDLSWFDLIVPCGIEQVVMTSLAEELLRDDHPALEREARQAVTDAFAELFGYQVVVPLPTP